MSAPADAQHIALADSASGSSSAMDPVANEHGCVRQQSSCVQLWCCECCVKRASCETLPRPDRSISSTSHLDLLPPCFAAFSRPRALPLVPGMLSDIFVDPNLPGKKHCTQNRIFVSQKNSLASLRRALASAASKSAAPLTFDRYPFLRELGLAPENAGVFNGTWGGSGDWFTSVNPATNEPIARVRGGTVAECVSLRCLSSPPASHPRVLHHQDNA